MIEDNIRVIRMEKTRLNLILLKKLVTGNNSTESKIAKNNGFRISWAT